MKVSGSIYAYPNPIRVAYGKAFGMVMLSWESRGTTEVEVRVGSPDGELFSHTGPHGKAPTGLWVKNGTVFYLQNVSGGLPLSSENTLATVTVNLIPIEEPAQSLKSADSCNRILSIYPLPFIPYTHDASASFISEKGILYAYEEEKLSRFQHAVSNIPEKSAMLGYKFLRIEPEQIDQLVITSIENCSQRSDFKAKVNYVKEMLHLKENIEVSCIPHHLAHSGLSVLSSPFDECVFLTMDGGGDGLMGHWGIFRDNKFKIVDQFEFSPAILYAYITCLAGFSLQEEGKVMGLSSYGQLNEEFYGWLKQNFWMEKATMRISERIRLQWQDSFDAESIDADTFRRHKYMRRSANFQTDEIPELLEELSPMEIAKTGQIFFEDLVFQAVSNLAQLTSLRNIALGGGAFLNIVANGKLHDIPGLKIHVSMAPHDSGLSLGAGLIRWHQKTGKRPEEEVSAYLGPSFDNIEIQKLLDSASIKYEKSLNIYRDVAREIAQGRVMGWFQGRGEFGARALGSRSVLADPRNMESKARLNQALKKRDWFMPYAPTILEEFGSQFFENFTPSPYMSKAFRVRPEMKNLVPSAIHVDGSCRAQTVNPQQNDRFYRLIREFYELTGIPMVLNTSFNRHGVPIVSTPRHAIQHLLEGNVDVLTMDDFLVYPEFLKEKKEAFYEDRYYVLWEMLAFGAKLAKSGRILKAQKIINEIGLPIQVSPKGLTFENVPIWNTEASEQALKEWWNRYWRDTSSRIPANPQR